MTVTISRLPAPRSMRCRRAAADLARALTVGELEVLDRGDRLGLARRRRQESLASSAQVVHRAGLLAHVGDLHHEPARDRGQDVLAERRGVELPSASTQKSEDVGASSTRPCGVTSSASSKPRSRAMRLQSMLAPYESDLTPSSTRVGAYSTTPSRTRSGVSRQRLREQQPMAATRHDHPQAAVEVRAAALREQLRDLALELRRGTRPRAGGSPPNARAGRDGRRARTRARRRRGSPRRRRRRAASPSSVAGMVASLRA